MEKNPIFQYSNTPLLRIYKIMFGLFNDDHIFIIFICFGADP